MSTRKTPDLSTRTLGSPSSTSSGSKQKEWAKEIGIYPFKVFLFILASNFFHAVKSYDI
jgi:hypothetical protein